jgi:ABC-type cobalamin/Fe3+-siderophores transport system ATPase subunit
MPEFTTYLARCSYMLERGQSTSDVLWYLGDEISHKPSQKFQFPAGYKYDYCNPDVLLNRLSVENGEIVTPEGLRYRMMWIHDTKRMLPETLEKLQQMIQQGAVVVADAPKGVATLRGREDAEKRVDEILDRLGLQYLKHKYNHKISGGEKRMAAIATILAMEPEAILMDEPTSALDPYNRRVVINTIKDLKQTKIITSHDLDMILDTCDRVILINDGKIVADGDAGTILRDKELLEANHMELPLRFQK